MNGHLRAISGAAIIERFGGTRLLARLLDIPPSTVQSWKRVTIPALWQPTILQLGQQLDPPLTPADFFREAAE